MTAHTLFNSLHNNAMVALLTCIAGSATAQIPNTLLHSIPAPPAGVQSGAQLGYSVAVDGDYTVAGAPYDDTGGSSSGVVKVFDSNTGALRLVLPNPEPAEGDYYGGSVAISGTWVVAGAWGDDTDALNSGSIYIYNLAGGTPTVPVFAFKNPTPAPEDNFGVSVAISGKRVVAGASKDEAGATDSGSAYVFDITNEAEPTFFAFNNPRSAMSDHFGISVGISGERVVVGTLPNGPGASELAGAYVYNLNGDTPTVHVTALEKPGPGANDRFGYAVAISGARAVVGAFKEGTGAVEAGSAYVYDLDNATPEVPVTTLNNPRATDFDHFGYSVAVSGARVVVGAYHDGEGATLAGSAYVYDLSSGTPAVPTAALNNPGPAFLDNFGQSVAISGTRVAVGAVHDDTGAEDAGSTYVYDLSSGAPAVPVVNLSNPDTPSAADFFGSAVAVSGKWAVVGAPSDDTGAVNAGSAYVYDLSGGTPGIPGFTLLNPSPVAADRFGSAVAVSGTRVVVGAVNDSTGALGAGSVYVYDLANAAPWVPVVTLHNPSPAANDGFGCAVAISGTRVVVGAYRDDTGAGDAGRVYVYDLNSDNPAVPVTTLNNPSPALSDFFGNAVAVSGSWVVAGAYLDDFEGEHGEEGTDRTDSGSAYLYDLTSATPTVPAAIFNNPEPAQKDYFGAAVSISGARVVVGAYAGVFDFGSARVYDFSNGIATMTVTTLTNPGGAFDDGFGASVAISGSFVIVGAMRGDAGASNAGSAYVYDLESVTPASPKATLNNPGPVAGDNFGASAAISGTTIVVGTPYDDTVMGDKGAAYIFGPPGDQDEDGLPDSWELTYWPTTAGHSAPDDADHDGYNELLELALGLNPTISNPGGLPAVINEGSYLTMTLTKRPGVTYEVQSASTLLTALPGSFNAASTTVLISNATTLKVRDNTPIGTGPRRFIRVKVTATVTAPSSP